MGDFSSPQGSLTLRANQLEAGGESEVKDCYRQMAIPGRAFFVHGKLSMSSRIRSGICGDKGKGSLNCSKKILLRRAGRHPDPGIVEKTSIVLIKRFPCSLISSPLPPPPA
jgi:hypothetical protein